MTRRIIACGGQQLYLRTLITYVLERARRPSPRVLFVPTASGDSESYIASFYRAMEGRDCAAAHLTLFDRTVIDLDSYLRGQDVIMVSGGNTANMLAIWRVHGFDRALRKAYDQGVVLTGWSAGCNCWFEESMVDSFGPLARLRDGLGYLKGSACPHYDSEQERRPTYTREVAAGMPAGIALEDGVAALYEDERLVEVITAREGGRAVAVDASGERPLDVRSIARSREEIAAEIMAMADADQRMPRAASDRMEVWDKNIDLRNIARMREILAEIGWPTRSKVGQGAEHNAWLLVQHADADREFQRDCLGLMRAQPSDEVCPKHLAYLEDRIRTADGQPQRYGTQMRRNADGTLQPQTLEDPERVDELRAGVGLGPLADYVAGFGGREVKAPAG